MPSVDVAMARSIQPSMWQKLTRSLANSVAQDLSRRSIVGDAVDKASDVKTAFSSWDNCMEAAYCKWPVIGVMIIGGLIILAIVTCIVRFCCCAKSCCCSCFSCFKCCGNCCGCCDPPGSRKHKYLDEPYIPPNQGYRTEAPMHTFPPVMGGANHGITPPQYAEFDMPKKGGEDSLPSMPSWEGSNSKKVEVEQEAMEMNNLNKPTGPHADQKDPLIMGMSPVSPVPRDNFPSPNPYGRSMPKPASLAGSHAPSRGPYAPNPYDTPADDYGLDQPYDIPPAGGPVGGAAAMGAMGAMHGGRNSPAPSQHRYGPQPGNQAFAELPAGPEMHPQSDPYRHTPSPGPAMGPTGYGMRQGSGQDPMGSRTASPAPGMVPNGYGMRQGSGQDPYGSRTASPGPGGYRGVPPNRMASGSPAPSRMGNNSPAPYGMDPRMRNSPAPRSPRPQGDPYARSPRQTPVSANGPGGFGPPNGSPMGSPMGGNFNRSYSPAPERQYAQSPRPMPRVAPVPQSPLAHHQEEVPSSPIVNNSGFDFTSGYSRPHASDNGNDYDRRPSESKEAPAQEGYPGYKPYRPAQDGWSGV